MIKGMFSHLSSAGRLALLLALILVFMLISSMLGFLLLMPSFGTGVIDLLARPDYSSTAVVNAMKFLQMMNMGAGLLLPAVIYVIITETNPLTAIGIRSKGNLSMLLLVALLLVVSQPLIGLANELNSRMSLPPSLSGLEHWMKTTEQQATELTEAFLSVITFGGLLLNIFMIAILPAITEELIFRGILARLLRKWTGSLHWAVIISSLIFAAIHLQFYGFLPRFILGAGLAYLYFMTGNLWVPILAHFVNNFLSVISEYLYRAGKTEVQADELGFYSNIYVIILSLMLSIGITLLIRKVSLSPKTGIAE